MTELFYPCNTRERNILFKLSTISVQGETLYLVRYKKLRNEGATVTEAIEAIEKDHPDLGPLG